MNRSYWQRDRPCHKLSETKNYYCCSKDGLLKMFDIAWLQEQRRFSTWLNNV